MILKICPYTGNSVLPSKKLGDGAFEQRRQYSPGTMSPRKFEAKIRLLGEGRSGERLVLVAPFIVGYALLLCLFLTATLCNADITVICVGFVPKSYSTSSNFTCTILFVLIWWEHY